MTALHTALASLRDEISKQIRSITPSRLIDPRILFEEFVSTEGNKDIRSASASARQFQIDAPVHVGDALIGNSTSHPEYSIDVVFSYPDTVDWRNAADDDVANIVWFFRTHTSAVSGVSLRFPMSDARITTEKASEDLRRFYTITLTAQFEVTYS